VGEVVHQVAGVERRTHDAAQNLQIDLRAQEARQVTIPIVLIHRRRAFQSGATRALMAMLTAWPRRD
jgi:hypothetical protein